MISATDRTSSVRLGSLIVLIMAFLTLNCVLSVINRWALGMSGFKFPLLLTACHMAFSFAALFPFMLREPYRGRHSTLLKESWKGILVIGVCQAANIALNNMSLVLITLSLNQIIRSAIPVVTASFAMTIEEIFPTTSEGFALITLTVGVMLAVWQGALAGSVEGIAICIIALLCNGATMSTIGKVLTSKIDVLALTFYTAPVSCLVLAPVVFSYEGERFRAYWANNTSSAVNLMAGTSVLALTYNIVHSMVIHQTSSVTTTVLGQTKIIAVIAVSAIFLGESSTFTPMLVVGTTLALGGFAAYSYIKTAHTPRDVALSLPVFDKEQSDKEQLDAIKDVQ